MLAMNASELLIHLTERQVDSLFRAARSLPEDKLDWKPAPDSRSALNQLQEVATAIDRFWKAQTDRKIEWSPEDYQNWMEERSKITNLDDLERRTRESIQRWKTFVEGVSEGDLPQPVELPFPGSFTLADVLVYHYWNMSYHEGQINYIRSLLEPT